MSLTDKIAEKLAGALGWLVLKELRRIAVAIEAGVDNQREERGLQPIFSKIVTSATPTADEDTTFADSEDPPHDFMRLEILGMLAEQQKIPVTMDTDLIALGKERGWLDQAGEIVMLPEGYGS